MTYTVSGSPIAIDWEQALSEHSSWLRSVVTARLGEPEAVDDVLQNVALAATTAAPRGLSIEKIAPWLYQVAVRQTLMYRRSAGRHRKRLNRFADGKAPHESDSREANPLDWLLAEERAKKIQQAIGQLHRRDREVLMLKYEQGWSYQQIADHLGIGHSAVEARLHRARQRLRVQLTRHDVMT